MELALEFQYLQRKINKFWPMYSRFFRKRKKRTIRKLKTRLHRQLVTKFYLNNSRVWYFGKKQFIQKWDKNPEQTDVLKGGNTVVIASITKW